MLVLAIISTVSEKKNNSDRSSLHSVMADGEEQFYSTIMAIFPVNCLENDSC